MLNETDLSRDDLNLLVLFEAVIEEGHVGRAADRLNISPSAVSHGLQRLRRQAGPIGKARCFSGTFSPLNPR